MSDGLPRWLSGKESACQAGAAGDVGSIPGLGRSPEEEMATESSIPCWDNPMDRGAWQAIGLATIVQTQLSD